MLVSVLQILDTSITNVALPHIQGALSAGLDEVSWVLTSYLAANAIILPATGWLTARLGRRRFFLLCTLLFTVSSFLSAIAPSVEFLIGARILQGLGGGPIIPIAQAVLWEIFPAAPAGHGHGGVGHGHRAGADLRADGGRLDRRQLVVAMDLLHQPAHRRGRLLRGEHPALRLAGGQARRPRWICSAWS